MGKLTAKQLERIDSGLTEAIKKASKLPESTLFYMSTFSDCACAKIFNTSSRSTFNSQLREKFGFLPEVTIENVENSTRMTNIQKDVNWLFSSQKSGSNVMNVIDWIIRAKAVLSRVQKAINKRL